MLDRTYTIAVTGAHGLLGAAFIRHAVSQGHHIVALDRKPLSFPPCSHVPPSPPDSTNDAEDGAHIPRTILDNPSFDSSLLDHALLRQTLALHSDSYVFEQVDLLDHDRFRRAVKEGGCDALVHLAAVYRQHDGKGNYLEGGLPEHEVYNINTAMSYNALSVAAELGIDRVALASSVNSVGMLFSHSPSFDYLPVDEKHPCCPEDAYSLAKRTSEIQASAVVRRNPLLPLRIASLRYHWVVPTPVYNKETISAHPGSHKDLWGWVPAASAARATLLAITSPLERFPPGHEAFFIVARTMCAEMSREKAMRDFWADAEWRGGEGEMKGNGGLFDTSKAERMLGWVEEGYPRGIEGSRGNSKGCEGYLQGK